MSFLINPYGFQAGASGDVTIVVQDFETGTATGAQSFTSSAISGVTPTGVLIIGGNHNVANDPNESASACIMVGSIVGTDDYTSCAFSSDAAGTIASRSGTYSNKGIEQVSGGGSVRKRATGQTISGGIELNFSTNLDSSQRHAFIAFTGSDVQAYTNVINLGTGTSAIDVNTVGFQPDVVIFYGSQNPLDTVSGGFMYTFGFATSDGTQRCCVMSEENAITDSEPYQSILTDAAIASLAVTNGALSYKVTAGSFDSSGFSVTPSASAGSDRVAYLALKFNGRSVKIVDFTTPTSTGSQAITGVGFTPQFALAVLTNLEAVDSFPGATSDLQSGFSLCAIGDEQWSTALRIDSGLATSDTATNMQNNAIRGASDTSTGAIVASLTSFDSDGMTLNYSAVQGTGKKGFILFIE